MLARHYADALLALALETGANHSALTKNLTATLTRRGHMALLPRIVAEYEKAVARAEAKQTYRLRVANTADSTEALQVMEQLVEKRGLPALTAEVVEDTSLISGFAVEGPGFRYDRSARAALMAMYKSLVA